MSYRPNANARTEVVDAKWSLMLKKKKRREALQAQQMPELANYTLVEKKLEHLPALVTGIWTDDNNMQLEATTQFWKLLSINWLDIVL
ncbi:Inositol monophosphatase 2 [Trifolium repens]|nr:Inositol monophosphatase 2 [Trifolium repens]